MIVEERVELCKILVKMIIIVCDLMVGNLKLVEFNFGEEVLGYNVIVVGF